MIFQVFSLLLLS